MLVPLSPRQTIDLAASALSSGRGAGLPELLELIQTLANRMEYISLGEIAGLIEQDPVVSARLINMANVIALNPGMTQLTSVPHAIHQIGFHRVRSLAISLMLLKSSAARQNPPEQRQAASRALCAGLMAQACARQIAAVDPEMVFACTTLRQLGRIVLPVVSIEHYRAAVEAAEEVPESDAFRRYFGLSPLELSRELLKSYKLPTEVRHVLGDFGSAGSPHAVPNAHSERLTSLADYGSRLTQIVLNVSLDEAAYEHETEALACAFAGTIPNARDLLATTLSTTGERLAQFTQMPGASVGTEVLLRRIRTRLYKVEEPAVAASPKTPGIEKPTPTALPADPLTAVPVASPAGPAPGRPSEIPAIAASVPALDRLPDAITLVPEPLPAVVANQPWLEVLGHVRTGFSADHCVVFLPAAESAPFVLAEGLGSFAVHHQDLATVHPADKTVFSIALTRRETVVIHDSRTASLVPYLPTWFKGDAHAPAAFLLVPLGNGSQIEGLVLVGWTQPRRIELNPGHEAVLNLLRGSAPKLCREYQSRHLARTGT